MGLYVVGIEELFKKIVVIEAENEETAVNKVKDKYEKELIVLTQDDYQGAEFYVDEYDAHFHSKFKK